MILLVDFIALFNITVLFPTGSDQQATRFTILMKHGAIRIMLVRTCGDALARRKVLLISSMKEAWSFPQEKDSG